MAFEEIREYFARHVLGRLKIRSGTLSLAAPTTRALRRSVEVYPLRARMNIQSPAILSFQGRLECSSGGFRFAAKLAEAKGERVRSPREIEVNRVPLRLAVPAKAWLRGALSLPQERVNRLKWRRPDGERPGEMILAWFSPIIEDAVIKLSLNKRRGTLLIWYDPKKGHSKVRSVCLCRRLSPGGKPEWRWAGV